MAVISEMPAKQKCTKGELTAAILQKAKVSGICSDLAELIIYGPTWRPNSNWDFGIRSKFPLADVRDECRIELNKIAGELQARFDLIDK
jgi:hypothetical protein